MNQHDKARPVSGEIMTGPGGARPERATDFTDAEFETVDRQRESAQEAAEPVRHAPADGMEMLRAAPPARPRRGGPVFWLCGLAIVAATFWGSGGHALVGTSAIQPVRQKAAGLEIGAVRSRVEQSSDRAILFIDGAVTNKGPDGLAVPALSIAVTRNDGVTTRYLLGTSDTMLQPGEEFAFSSRLPAPEPGVKSVAVTFSQGDD